MVWTRVRAEGLKRRVLSNVCLRYKCLTYIAPASR